VGVGAEREGPKGGVRPELGGPDAKTLLADKEADINRLRKDLAFKAEHTVRLRGLTFEQNSKGGPQGMPFCPCCESVDGRLVRIVGTRKGLQGRLRMELGYTYESDRPER
jgi:hypothetical protein